MVLVKYNPDKQRFISAMHHGNGAADSFKGVVFQRGFGIFRKLKRSPIILRMKPHLKTFLNKSKPIIKNIGREIVKSGAEGMKDILVKKHTPKEAYNTQKQAIKRKLTSATLDALNMSGAGVKKPKIDKKKVSEPKKTKKKVEERPKKTKKKVEERKVKPRKKSITHKNKIVHKNKSIKQTNIKKSTKKQLSKGKSLKNKDIFT